MNTTETYSDRLRHAGREARSLLSFMSKRFMHDRIVLSAGSLAFQTLLSLVPLLAVILSTLKGFPFFASLKLYMGDFLFQNFAPSQGALLKEYLWAYIDNASTVPFVGGGFLFVIALFLISTIDHTLNGIWEVHAPRRFVQGFTLYWTVLTLGPVLIGTSMVASSFVWYAVFSGGGSSEIRTRMLSFVPVLNSVIAFTMLYLLVPNRRVRIVHAFAGGLLAAVLFELARRWFTFYVSHFATFEHIYGALSVVPMMFFWIYLEWVVVLTGAEFVYSLGYRVPETAPEQTFSPLKGMRAVIVVLDHIWRGQSAGRFVDMKKLFAEENIPDRSKLSLIVDLLLQKELIHLTADGGLAISADLHSLTLYDLYTKLPPEIVHGDETASGIVMGRRLEEVCRGVQGALKSGMDVPLAELLNDSLSPDS